MIWQPSTSIWAPPNIGPIDARQKRHECVRPVARRRSTGTPGAAAVNITAPTAFWRMEDATDSGGNGLDLTNNNSVTFTAGKISNGATMLSASSQSLTHADTALLRASGSISICMWLKMNTNGNPQRFLCKWAGSTQEYGLAASGVSPGTPYNVTFQVQDGSSTTAAIADCFGALNSATYYFLVVTFDTGKTAPNNMGVSLNGATLSFPAASGSITAIRSGTGTFQVGQDGFGDNLNGQIDALGWWNNYALTSAEVSALYNSGNGMEYFSGAWH